MSTLSLSVIIFSIMLSTSSSFSVSHLKTFIHHSSKLESGLLMFPSLHSLECIKGTVRSTRQTIMLAGGRRQGNFYSIPYEISMKFGMCRLDSGPPSRGRSRDDSAPSSGRQDFEGGRKEKSPWSRGDNPAGRGSGPPSRGFRGARGGRPNPDVAQSLKVQEMLQARKALIEVGLAGAIDFPLIYATARILRERLLTSPPSCPAFIDRK